MDKEDKPKFSASSLDDLDAFFKQSPQSDKPAEDDKDSKQSALNDFAGEDNLDASMSDFFAEDQAVKDEEAKTENPPTDKTANQTKDDIDDIDAFFAEKNKQNLAENLAVSSSQQDFSTPPDSTNNQEPVEVAEQNTAEARLIKF